ncbi:WW domain-containing protein [Colletotrichum chrysophilum]|uniref:WW domain-containing protein n=1 Tax=Colletotrichum chrysophilum TaxID=1836956 RepID=A0AAD9AWN6_9PEZI|nr:WW domain-containing protein [Colletotrichum chrysophilum]
MSLFGNFDVAKLASQLGGFTIPDDPEIQHEYGSKDFGYSNHGSHPGGYDGQPPSGYAGGPQNGADEYKREHPDAFGTADPERSAAASYGAGAFSAAAAGTYGAQAPYPTDSPRPEHRYGDQQSPYPSESPRPEHRPYGESASPYRPPPPEHGDERPPSPRLPEGWAKRFDERSGRWYYVSPNNSTQWEPPAPLSPVVSPPPPEPRYEDRYAGGGHSPRPGYGGHSPQPGYGGHSPAEYAAGAAAAGAVAGAAAGYYAGHGYEQSQPHQQPQYHDPNRSYGQPGYGQPQGSPYGQPQGSPYGQPHASPFGQPSGSPYGGGSPYGQPQASPYGQPQQQAYGHPYGQQYEQGSEEKKKKKSSSSNMLLGVAGGLAVGAIGGALIANALGLLRFVSYQARLLTVLQIPTLMKSATKSDTRGEATLDPSTATASMSVTRVTGSRCGRPGGSTRRSWPARGGRAAAAAIASRCERRGRSMRRSCMITTTTEIVAR